MSGKGALRRRLTFVPFMLVLSGVLLVLAAIVGFAVGGAVAAAGAAIGIAVVAVSFTASSLLIAWADSINPKLVLSVGMLAYLVKFSGLFLALTLTSINGWSGLRPMAIAIAVGTIAWISGHAWWLWHAKIPYVDTDV